MPTVALYMADSDFVDVPVAGLLDFGLSQVPRAADRSVQGTSMGRAKRQDFRIEVGRQVFRGEKPLMTFRCIEYGTSHLSIVDAQRRCGIHDDVGGRTASASHIMAGGFILNNQLTDFSFRAGAQTVSPVANRVEAGKRPRSSMSPSLVLDGQWLSCTFAAIGSPGGSRIITYVTQTLIALLDWQMPMQDAIDLPRALNRNWRTEVEAGRGLDQAAEALRRMGHEIQFRGLTSGLHGIRVVGDKLDGGADRRREGKVIEILP